MLEVSAEPKHHTHVGPYLHTKTTELQRKGNFADDEKMDFMRVKSLAQHVVDAVQNKRISQTIKKDVYEQQYRTNYAGIRAFTRLDIVHQNLREPSYGSSPDQTLYGKAREHRKKSSDQKNYKQIIQQKTRSNTRPS